MLRCPSWRLSLVRKGTHSGTCSSITEASDDRLLGREPRLICLCLPCA